MLGDVIEDENLLPFMTFANQDVLNATRSVSGTSSRVSSVASLTSTFSQAPAPGNQYPASPRNGKFKDNFQAVDIDDIELPTSVDTITDLFENFLLQFSNLKAEVIELQQRMNMKIVETQMKLEIQRTYI